MAGKIRHLVVHHGRFYARVVVPKKLRAIIGKGEFWEPLDADRRIALRLLPGAVARMNNMIDAARVQTGAAPQHRTLPLRHGKTMTAQEMAVAHYGDMVRFDDEARNSDHRFSSGFADENYVNLLRRAVVGSAPDDELEGTVGRIVGYYQDQGQTKAMKGSAEWRELSRALAAAEFEALSRTAERDEGNFGGQPSHPILTEKVNPTLASDPLAARSSAAIAHCP